MSDKDYRRDWAQEQAKARLRELRGDNVSQEEIGETIGVSGVFIGQILRKVNPKPVSRKVWDGLIEHYGLKPHPPITEVPGSATEKVQTNQTAVVPEGMCLVPIDDYREMVLTLKEYKHLLVGAFDRIEGLMKAYERKVK